MKSSRTQARLLCAALLLLLGSGVAFAQQAPPAEPPQIHRVDPNVVSVLGGATISVLGEHFDIGSEEPPTVWVGGQPCTDVRVHSSSRISAVVPASAGAGPVDVEVRHPDGTSDTLAEGLCYDDGKIWTATWFRLKGRAMSAWYLLAGGGTIMVLLALLSICAVAWVLHCAFVIRPGQIIPKGLLDKLGGHLARGEIQTATDTCRQDGSVFARVALAALKKSGESTEKTREVAQAAGSREAAHLFQKISYLSNIGVISPMLGLLGTVLGMILAFKTIGMGESVAKHLLLASAIHKAMITTAAGLVIGIPAMACYYYFRGKLLGILTDMEQVTEEMAEAIADAGEER
jgi:biopolymer transport protein ExbB